LKNPFKRLTSKVIFFSALIFALLSAAIGLVTNSIVSTNLTENLTRDLRQRSTELRLRLEDGITEKKKVLKLFSENVNVQIALKRNRFSIVGHLFNDWLRDSSFSQFLLLKEDGTILVAQNQEEYGNSVADQSWFKEAKANGISEGNSFCQKHNHPAFWMASLIVVNDQQYYLMAQVHWAAVYGYLDGIKVAGENQSRNNYVLVCDKKGTLLYVPPFIDDKDETMRGKNIFDSGKYRWIKATLQTGNEGTFIDEDLWGEENFTAYSTGDNSPFITICAKNKIESLSILQEIFHRNIKISILIFGIGLFVLLLIIRRITRPIHNLAQTAAQISEGRYPDIGHIHGDQEVMQLVRAFNFMTDGIKSREQRLTNLIEAERETSLKLSSANKTLGRQSAELQGKNEDLRRTMIKLREAQEALLRAEKLAVVGETSGRVAHEVLNPITSILSKVENDLCQWAEFRETFQGLGEIIEDWQREYQTGNFAEYLKSKDDNGACYGDEDFTMLVELLEVIGLFGKKREENLDFVRKQIHRVVKIVNALRESAITNRAIIEINLAKTLDEVFDLLGDSLNKRGIDVQTSVPADLPAIEADETELIQIFSNLARNAMQSIDEKGQRSGIISTVATVNDGCLQIRMRDNGTGIAPEAQTAIFDFNFTTKKKDQGTGLGLGISRRLAREYGGDILLEESTEGIGSTFLVVLPIASAPPSSPTAS
jgi:signal transduction histidine kinase